LSPKKNGKKRKTEKSPFHKAKADFISGWWWSPSFHFIAYFRIAEKWEILKIMIFPALMQEHLTFITWKQVRFVLEGK
jgi:hypothetical protein